MSAIEKLLREIRYAGFNRLFIKKCLRKLGSQILLSSGNIFPFKPRAIEKLSVRPPMIGFAVTNICNANCVFCGYRHLRAAKGIMNFEIFRQGIDDLSHIGGGDISLTPVVGDPLIDTGLIDKIRYARALKNIYRIGMYTNGILLDKAGIRELLLSGITDISISIGGFDKRTYKKIFGVDSFERAYNNIVMLAKINKELKNPVKIFLGIRSDKPLSVLVKSRFYKKISRFIDNITYQYNFDSWSGLIKESELVYPMRLQEIKVKKEPCAVLYGSLTILWNGSVTACGCRELNGDSELMLGNIKQQSLISLWRSRKMDRLRSGFYSGRIPDICKNCAHYNPLSVYKLLYYQKAKNNYKAFLDSDYNRFLK